MKQRTYIAIDLKSFYASVECRERGLDPLDTNLVVADESRTDKTICLAVTPSLKSYGISGRGRLFEQLLCLRAARRLRWYCCEAVFAEAGTEAASLALRPGMQELLRSAADGEFDVLLIVDAEHLFCSPAEIECLLSTLLRSGVHTFCAKSGHWLEPNGRHWMVLPNYDSISLDDWEDFDV